MQLFTRSVPFTGALADVMGWASGMREYVSGKTGREVALWNVLFGAPIGTNVYTLRVDGLADLQSITQGLVADPEYHAMLASGAALTAGPPVDSLATPIHGELGDTPPPIGSVATVTTAVMEAGMYGKAIAWGIDVAQHVEAVSGLPVSFLMSDFGQFGLVEWIGVAPDAATADAVGQKLNADADYLGKLEGAAGLFTPGSGHRSLAVRSA